MTGTHDADASGASTPAPAACNSSNSSRSGGSGGAIFAQRMRALLQHRAQQRPLPAGYVRCPLQSEHHVPAAAIVTHLAKVHGSDALALVPDAMYSAATAARRDAYLRAQQQQQQQRRRARGRRRRQRRCSCSSCSNSSSSRSYSDDDDGATPKRRRVPHDTSSSSSSDSSDSVVLPSPPAAHVSATAAPFAATMSTDTQQQPQLPQQQPQPPARVSVALTVAQQLEQQWRARCVVLERRRQSASPSSSSSSAVAALPLCVTEADMRDVWRHLRAHACEPADLIVCHTRAIAVFDDADAQRAALRCLQAASDDDDGDGDKAAAAAGAAASLMSRLRLVAQHPTAAAAAALSALPPPSPTTTRPLRGSIQRGREQLAAQFATMDGWQARQDARFDAYVAEQRQRQRFDAFDQRVERAYAAAARAHKAEVVNAFKRRLTSTSSKYTAQTALDLQAAVQERLRWLREVWSQVDADYRSDDDARQAVAAREIAAALHGEPGEYMQWVYERQRTRQLAGPKTRAALDADVADAELPEVADEEVSRYHALRLRMADVERHVKTRFGVAGQQHWAELQAAKDAVYSEKLSHASDVYEQLVAQNARYEESQRTANLRSTVARVHEAQVRFKAAMALERERETAVAAHAALTQQRARAARDARIAALREAAELRARGATSAEVRAAMAQRRLATQAQQQAEAALREREHVLQRKHHYLDLIEQMRSDAEWRDGRELLAGADASALTPARARSSDDGATAVAGASASPSSPSRAQTLTATRSSDDACNVYGFDDADALSDGSDGRNSSISATTTTAAGMTAQAHETDATATRGAALWAALRADTYEDATRTVHQARLDAAHTHDALYEGFLPFTLAQGVATRQGMGENAGGNESDAQVLKRPESIMAPYFWGVQPGSVHDLDADGSKGYFMHTSWHVRDRATGDIDWRYERRKGGAAFTGPRFYRLGAEREARDAGMQTTEPLPYTRHTRAHFATTKSPSPSRREHTPWQPPSASSATSRSGGASPSWRSE